MMIDKRGKNISGVCFYLNKYACQQYLTTVDNTKKYVYKFTIFFTKILINKSTFNNILKLI